MWKPVRYMVGICCILIPVKVQTQDFRVSDPRMELIGNALHITYDILNSDPSDEFSVSLRIKDAEGNPVRATALAGDVGQSVSGGSNKKIVWDLSVDGITMDANIFVKVQAKLNAGPEQVVAEPVQEEEQPFPEESGTEESVSDSREKSFSRAGLILQSVAFPGLGLSRLTGDPHWIKGVAGYGCLAGSVYLNRKAVSNYSGIIDLADYDEKNELYQKSVTQDQISEVMFVAAVAIWVSDIIWTVVGTSRLKKGALSMEGSAFSLQASVDPYFHAPLMGITFRF